MCAPPVRRIGEVRHQDPTFRGAHPILQTTELGSVTAHRIKFSAVGTAPQVLEADPGQHALVLSSQGEISVARDERELLVRGEAVALCDTRLPLGISPTPRNPTAEAVVMVFPGRASGLGAPEVARFGDAALHLAAAVLERHFTDADEAGPQTEQHELLTRIRGFIDRNLGEPDLSPSLVASAHHISIRYLQRLFKTEGSTPSDWIRQRRLENSRRELCDAKLRSASIREIGLRNGFAQPSDFSRVFRANYGIPPGKFRDDWFRRDAVG